MFIQLMIFMIFIIDYIQHLINEFKILIFAYTSNLNMYFLLFIVTKLFEFFSLPK